MQANFFTISISIIPPWSRLDSAKLVRISKISETIMFRLVDKINFVTFQIFQLFQMFQMFQIQCK